MKTTEILKTDKSILNKHNILIQKKILIAIHHNYKVSLTKLQSYIGHKFMLRRHNFSVLYVGVLVYMHAHLCGAFVHIWKLEVLLRRQLIVPPLHTSTYHKSLVFINMKITFGYNIKKCKDQIISSFI